MVASMQQRETEPTRHHASWQQTSPETGEALQDQPLRRAQAVYTKDTARRKGRKTGTSVRHQEETSYFDENDRCFSDELASSGRLAQQGKNSSTQPAFHYDDDEYQSEEETDEEDHEVENAIRQYLAEIGRYPLLTAEQEMQIALR